MLEIIQHFKPLTSFLVFCLLVAKVNADQDSATPEIHPPIVEWEAGEYVFKTYNYYDRNALFINHQPVCRYRGSVAGGSDGGVEQSKERIVLQEGYIPFVLVGYVDARGGIDTLRWAPPGSKGHEPLPLEKLYYSEELARSLNQQRQLFNFTAPKKL